MLRSLIDRIELRGDGKSVDAVLHLREKSHGVEKFPKTGISGSQLSVVAGTGFVQERTRWELRRVRLRLVAGTRSQRYLHLDLAIL